MRENVHRGRPPKPREQWLTEYEIEILLLMKGYSIRRVAELCRHSTTTMQRLKKRLEL